MTDWFVDDAAADNTGTGAWDDPLKFLWETSTEVGIMTNSTLGGGAASVDAGDRVFVMDGDDETGSTAAITLTNNGTAASPIQIIPVAGFASGSPTTLGTARSNVVGHASAASGRDITLQNGLILWGIHIKAGDEILGLPNDNDVIHLIKCRLEVLRSGGLHIALSSISAGKESKAVLDDVWFKFTSPNTGSIKVNGHGIVTIRGGKVESGSATHLFDSNVNGLLLDADAFDMSAWTGTNILNNASDEAATAVFKNCKTPSSFTYVASTPAASAEYLFMGCSNGVNNAQVHFAQFSGNVVDEGTIIRQGGAADSILMQPNTNVSLANPLRCINIGGKADFSSSKTIDIYIGNATRDLNDTEIYGILSYPAYNTGGNKTADNRGANWLAAAANHADDTGSTWDGGGLTYMQKMSWTAGGSTDGRSGEFNITLFLAVDVDVYIDGLLVVA